MQKVYMIPIFINEVATIAYISDNEVQPVFVVEPKEIIKEEKKELINEEF